MLDLRRTPEALGTDLWPKMAKLAVTWEVGRQCGMFLLCYSPEGHKLPLNTRYNSGLLAIDIDKLHDRF